MVILILLLWSLCAVYITRFLYQRGLKIAALVYTILYVYLTAWVFLISYLDVAQFGFVPDQYADLYAGDLYRSLAGVVALFDRLPAELLIGIVFACIAVCISVVAMLVIGGVRLYKAIAVVLKGKALGGAAKREAKPKPVRIAYAPTRIYLQYCRLNN